MNTTVFYIDDDVDDAQLVEEILAEMGHPSCVFQNPTDLMQLLENPPPAPSVIFIDLNMPKVDGLEVLDNIRACTKFAEVPIVMLSNTVVPNKVIQCREHGANMFMTKATSMTKIKSSFRHVLEIDWKSFDNNEDSFLFVA